MFRMAWLALLKASPEPSDRNGYNTSKEKKEKGCTCTPDPARSLLGLFVVGAQRAGLFPLLLGAATEPVADKSRWLHSEAKAGSKWAGSVVELLRDLKSVWDVDQMLHHTKDHYTNCRTQGFKAYREEAKALELQMATRDIIRDICFIFDYRLCLQKQAQLTGIKN
jgi:hypothetical protein